MFAHWRNWSMFSGIYPWLWSTANDENLSLACATSFSRPSLLPFVGFLLILWEHRPCLPAILIVSRHYKFLQDWISFSTEKKAPGHWCRSRVTFRLQISTFHPIIVFSSSDFIVTYCKFEFFLFWMLYNFNAAWVGFTLLWLVVQLLTPVLFEEEISAGKKTDACIPNRIRVDFGSALSLVFLKNLNHALLQLNNAPDGLIPTWFVPVRQLLSSLTVQLIETLCSPLFKRGRKNSRTLFTLGSAIYQQQEPAVSSIVRSPEDCLGIKEYKSAPSLSSRFCQQDRSLREF